MRFIPFLPNPKPSKNAILPPPEPNGSVPQIFLKHLTELEPGAQFEFSPPDLIISSDAVYSAKTGTISKRTQLREAEAKMLKLLDKRAPGLAPPLLASGFFTRFDQELNQETYRTYFLYKWEELRPLSSASAEVLARRLANEVHAYKGSKGYGIYDPTDRSPNRIEHSSYWSWKACFSALMDGVLSRLRHLNYPVLCTKGTILKKRVISKLLSPAHLKIRPVLIHGNLWNNHWGGNAGENANRNPVACNPAPMFAHNEFDLAIGGLHGKLHPSFYTEYHRHYPKSNPVEEYDLRSELYTLFFYLNHAVTFGRRYANVAEEKMDNLLRLFPPTARKLRFASHDDYVPRVIPRSKSVSPSRGRSSGRSPHYGKRRHSEI